MPKKSAGLLLYRKRDNHLEVFLVHPGGPFWATKDLGAWSIPKGEFEDEEPLEAARREFLEETGFDVAGDFIALSPIRQKSGKKVFAWAIEADVDPSKLKSNTFDLEFPPKSGLIREFPEIDRAEWFAPDMAKRKIISYQVAFISELAGNLGFENDSEDHETKRLASRASAQGSLF